MPAEIYLERICDGRVAMILVVNLAAQAHAKRSDNDADSNSDLGVKADS